MSAPHRHPPAEPQPVSILDTAAFWLKASRPGLWFPTLWLYLMPLSGMDVFHSPAFWAGVAFVTFPLNLLIYGWNDLVDVETDALNPRKDSFLFGARPTATQRQQLPWGIAIVLLISAPPIVAFGGVGRMILVLLGIIAVTALYNLPKWGLRGKPPLELFCQFGYLLVVPISVWLNDAVMPGTITFIYLSLFCIQSQLIGEVMDIVPDRKAGRKTTATALGMRNTKILIIAIVAVEVALLFGFFGDPLFAGVLGLFLIWLILDIAVIFRTQQYTLNQMRLLGVGSNLVAIATMGYVYGSGCLMSLDGPWAKLLV
ncbi:MAG: UbiA family prenyltransferase [Myxococcota bacterium]